MASLRFRGGKYFVDYRVKGRRVRKAVGKTRKTAELALKDIEVKLERQDAGFIEKDFEIAKLFPEFLNYSITHHSAATQKRYKGILANFQRFLTLQPYIKKISQLSQKFFEDYQAFRKRELANNTTVNTEMVCLHSMFGLAVRWNYSLVNPTQGVKSLKEEADKKPRFLSKEECRALLEHCNEHLYPIFYTFLYTGMRKSELEYLTWSDIDFERKKIKIRYKDDWSPKTSEREIPINNGLLEVLQKQKEKKSNSCPYVFHKNDQRIYPDKLRKELVKITKACGFPDVTKIHSLRHTFASHLVMSGVDLPTVKRLLGHADIETTMIYAHLADEHVDRAVEKLSF
ncbi:MAG: tyrosine-type recombinase/integrase [Candidatus Omnitrophica bacterium]|nr:tyrosine-type recombinase/integrase [Candidatus Omnitrophota bacterium]MDE2223162.1 tyrosine-type recombinase/integrase [Candidatus Omnitrophota bacterium]